MRVPEEKVLRVPGKALHQATQKKMLGPTALHHTEYSGPTLAGTKTRFDPMTQHIFQSKVSAHKFY